MSSAESTGRFYFESLGGCVRSRVSRRERHRLTLEQPLPFLRQQTTVRDELQRQGHVESVRLAMDRGTPHLVVELAYDEPEPTAPYEVPAPRFHEIPVGRPEETVPFDTHSPDVRRTIPVGLPAQPMAAPALRPRADRGDTPIVFRPADHLQPGEPLYGDVRQDEALQQSQGWWSRLWTKLSRRQPS